MEKHFSLLDADLSNYRCGKYWGDGRYEDEIKCEGVYLYRTIHADWVLIAKVRQEYNLFSTSKYELFVALDLTGRYINENDFIIHADPEKIKRVNICLTHEQDTSLRILSRYENRSKSEIIREALNDYLKNKQPQARVDFLSAERNVA